jgi:hypothetical protein
MYSGVLPHKGIRGHGHRGRNRGGQPPVEQPGFTTHNIQVKCHGRRKQQAEEREREREVEENVQRFLMGIDEIKLNFMLFFGRRVSFLFYQGPSSGAKHGFSGTWVGRFLRKHGLPSRVGNLEVIATAD